MPVPSNNTYQLDEVLSPQAKESLSHLELFARRAVKGWIHGGHPSKRLGASTEFDHHKTYQPGDPIKSIDWKASARLDRVFIKRSIEDSVLSVRLVVDRSASMGFSTVDAPSKFLQAARAAACLAYLITSHSDSVGLTMTCTDQTFWLHAGSTQRHFVHVLVALASKPAQAQDNLHVCLRTLVDRSERRGIVALVSDLMFDPAPVRAELARLRAQGHEIILFQPQDPTEQDFPFNRWVLFGDLENQGVMHRVDAVILKRFYREELQRLQEGWTQWAKKYDVHQVAFSTADRMDEVISSYMAVRNGRGFGGH